MDVRGKEKSASKCTLPSANLTAQSTTEVLLLHKDHYVYTLPPHSHGRSAMYWEAKRTLIYDRHLEEACDSEDICWGPCQDINTLLFPLHREKHWKTIYVTTDVPLHRMGTMEAADRAFPSPPPLKPWDPTNSWDSIILGSSAQTQTGAIPNTELMRYLIL